jgi:hypothetical protein
VSVLRSGRESQDGRTARPLQYAELGTATLCSQPPQKSVPKTKAVDSKQKPTATGADIAKTILAKPDEAARLWDQVFAGENAPEDSRFADAIVYLHSRRHYNVAVEGMLSAIRNDRGAPWMYDALALEMKLAGRPASEIARVIESRVDFATSDIEQLLITAALLSRFEAWDESIAMCREAVELNPESAQAWLLGRSVSDKAAQPKFQVWFRCGILKYVWDNEFPLHHEEARQVIMQICDRFDREGKSPEAQGFRDQFQEAKAVDLQINLSWVGPADLDLLITEPNGEKCSYKRRFTANSGRLVREEGVGEPGATKHLESYVCHSAPSGDYEVAVRFVLGKAVAGTAVLEIIHHAGTAMEKRESKTIKLAKDDVTVKTTLTNGRADSKAPTKK